MWSTNDSGCAASSSRWRARKQAFDRLVNPSGAIHFADQVDGISASDQTRLARGQMLILIPVDSRVCVSPSPGTPGGDRLCARLPQEPRCFHRVVELEQSVDLRTVLLYDLVEL